MPKERGKQLSLGFVRDCDYPEPPSNYGPCLDRRHLRTLPASDPKAERCQALGCRYNLLRVLAKLPESKAEAVLIRRYERGLWHTCALDVAAHTDDGSAPFADGDLCTMLGEPPRKLQKDVEEIIESTRLDWLLRSALDGDA